MHRKSSIRHTITVRSSDPLHRTFLPFRQPTSSAAIVSCGREWILGICCYSQLYQLTSLATHNIDRARLVGFHAGDSGMRTSIMIVCRGVQKGSIVRPGAAKEHAPGAVECRAPTLASSHLL